MLGSAASAGLALPNAGLCVWGRNPVGVRVERRVSAIIGPRPKIAPKKPTSGHVVAWWRPVPQKADLPMVLFARGLAWSWVTSSTLVDQLGQIFNTFAIPRLRE